MKQVLWPKYLLGGMLQRSGGGMGDVESQGFGRDLRGLVGRWPDADGILQGGLSEGLRDWDLWYAREFHLRFVTNVAGDLSSSVFSSAYSCHSELVKVKRTLSSLASFRLYGLVKRW